MIEDRLRENLRAEAAALPPAPPPPVPRPARPVWRRPTIGALAAAALVLVAVGGAAVTLLRERTVTRLDLVPALPAGDVTWRQVDPGLAEFNAAGIAHAPAGYVIAADAAELGAAGAAAVSADGDEWETTPVPGFAGHQLVEMAASSRGYLTLGFAPEGGVTMFFSPDGRDWTAQALDVPQLGQVFPQQLAAFGDLAVATVVHFPSDDSGEPPSVLVWVSADGGRTWGPAATSVFPLEAMVTRVAAGPAGLLAALDTPAGPQLWRSDTGDGWVQVAAPPGASLFALTGGGSGYLATMRTAADTEVWASADGTAWELSRLVGAGSFVTLQHGSVGGFVVALAPQVADPAAADPFAAGLSLDYSPDGVAWRAVGEPADFPEGFVAEAGVAVGDGRILAVGLPVPMPQIEAPSDLAPIVMVGTVTE